MSHHPQNTMNSIADAARAAHVLVLAELCSIARECGLRAELPDPYDTHPGAVRIQLGRQLIAVHLVANTAGAARRQELLRREILQSPWVEHYVVLTEFTEDAVAQYQGKFENLRMYRVTVGCRAKFAAWVRARLGPLAHLDQTSPVRRLMEDLLCVTRTAGPAEKDALTCVYKPSRIKEDFDYGQMGVQAAGTLFSHAKGPGAVKNLEGIMSAQKKGTDLDVASSYLADSDLSVEVKTESYPSGRITLELHSCYMAKEDKPPLARTPGWLGTSQAHLLQSTIWPTGDSIVVDFSQLKQWVNTNPRGLTPRLGGMYAKQDYYSWILLANMEHILKDIPGAVHVRLGDWLPTLYKDEFKVPSLVAKRLGRTLEPQRLG